MTIVRLEGLGKLKKSTSSGLDPATLPYKISEVNVVLLSSYSHIRRASNFPTPDIVP
jgi:hypothetical protein